LSTGGRLKVWDGESGELHRQLEGFGDDGVTALASFLSPDGQQPRLVAGSGQGEVEVYDPEAGSVRRFDTSHSHCFTIHDLACIASSSATPHHPLVVTASDDGTAKVWDGETGGWLADLRGHKSSVRSLAVWKEHTGGHDRIATTDWSNNLRVWDGETFTLLHELAVGSRIWRALAFESAEGPTRLLLPLVADFGLQVWDPEEGRLLHDGINRGRPISGGWHLFESAQGRHLLAIVAFDENHPRHPRDTYRTSLDVWDLGEAPATTGHVRPAHHLG
jgi:WD40 repeat protein